MRVYHGLRCPRCRGRWIYSTITGYTVCRNCAYRARTEEFEVNRVNDYEREGEEKHHDNG